MTILDHKITVTGYKCLIPFWVYPYITLWAKEWILFFSSIICHLKCGIGDANMDIVMCKECC